MHLKTSLYQPTLFVAYSQDNTKSKIHYSVVDGILSITLSSGVYNLLSKGYNHDCELVQRP